MKLKILFIVIVILAANLGFAQVLYTEDFDNLNVGNVGTDPTGQIPGQGGWYTMLWNSNLNSDVYIENESNKGKILAIKKGPGKHHNEIILKDLDKLFNQKNPGNNIIKLSFEFYTNSSEGTFISGLRTAQGKALCNFWYSADDRSLRGSIPNGIAFSSGESLGSSKSNNLILPDKSWITLELFIDYTTSLIYFRVPSMNVTRVFSASSQLLIDPTPDASSDIPFSLHFSSRIDEDIKIDNINLSAVNIAPTVSNSNFVSERFNIFPNPVTDIVTITNSENIGIEEITVYDINDKTVKSKSYSMENQVKLNIGELSTGTYLFHIKTNEGMAVKKVIKK